MHAHLLFMRAHFIYDNIFADRRILDCVRIFNLCVRIKTECVRIFNICVRIKPLEIEEYLSGLKCARICYDCARIFSYQSSKKIVLY